MKLKHKSVLLLLSAVLLAGLPVTSAANPLDAFGALVVGEWETDDSRHVLEWGVGKRVIRSRSYQQSEDGWTLVGEGMWFWDSGEETIRGIVVAIGMPVDLFDYRSELKDGEILHDLVAQGPAGGEYVERWVVTGDEYRWSLEVEIDGKPEVMMKGAYRRVETKP